MPLLLKCNLHAKEFLQIAYPEVGEGIHVGVKWNANLLSSHMQWDDAWVRTFSFCSYLLSHFLTWRKHGHSLDLSTLSCVAALEVLSLVQLSFMLILKISQMVNKSFFDHCKETMISDVVCNAWFFGISA